MDRKLQGSYRKRGVDHRFIPGVPSHLPNMCCLCMIVKDLSHPQKLANEVRGSPTYILPLPFHNQCGTIQQSPPSHIGVPQPFTIPSPILHGPSGTRALLVFTIHQVFTHFVPQAKDVELVRI
uniref:Uncharacterized protein n=2 Tax=Oryza sativa subsp. japonica TaxID=39947 RepID=Q53KR1_ORYSJ|nr:hypothetical protein LOC_Os11g15740 [Oryza sativa Japonica Group]ABA92478.1 hypothetical protein LOC_Os11g15740 [Oryza sativa Japonica Group]